MNTRQLLAVLLARQAHTHTFKNENPVKNTPHHPHDILAAMHAASAFTSVDDSQEANRKLHQARRMQELAASVSAFSRGIRGEPAQPSVAAIGGEADPHGKDPHSPGAKLDAGKERPWLMLSGFANALRAVAEVTTVGATKYTPNGWKSVVNGPERYMDAFGRHMLALGGGEIRDGETGCYHKAQMIWNLLAALELEMEPLK